MKSFQQLFNLTFMLLYCEGSFAQRPQKFIWVKNFLKFLKKESEEIRKNLNLGYVQVKYTLRKEVSLCKIVGKIP